MIQPALEAGRASVSLRPIRLCRCETDTRSGSRRLMKLRPFRSVTIVMGAAAIIAVGTLLVKSQPGRDGNANAELLRGLCNRDVVIAKRYHAKAREVRTLLESGKIDRWKDFSFRSPGGYQDVYVPYPNEHLNKAGVRLNMIDVHLEGGKIFEMRIPVVRLKNPIISLNLPEHRYLSCLDVLKNDFVDYM